MLDALNVLAYSGPVVGKWNLARQVGPHGSDAYGDRIVMRCIRAGLIDFTVDERGVYTLTLSDAEIRSGTGFPRGTSFVQLPDPKVGRAS